MPFAMPNGKPNELVVWSTERQILGGFIRELENKSNRDFAALLPSRAKVGFLL
jgi:hypothetical protein